MNVNVNAKKVIIFIAMLAIVIGGAKWFKDTKPKRKAEAQYKELVRIANRQEVEIAIIEQAVKLKQYRTALKKLQQKKSVKEKPNVIVDSTSIAACADYTGTVAGTVLVTSAAHGLVTGDLATISGTTNYNSDYSITFVATNTFYIVEDFVADDATGTVQWTSLRLAFRYARPTSTRVTDVYDGGVPIDDWVRKGNWILTNLTSDDVEMDYIRAVADLTVTEFPAHFNEVQWRKMAIHMLYSRVQSRALQEQLITELEQIYLPRAIGMDSREKFVQEESQAWTAAGHTTTFIE